MVTLLIVHVISYPFGEMLIGEGLFNLVLSISLYCCFGNSFSSLGGTVYFIVNKQFTQDEADYHLYQMKLDGSNVHEVILIKK